MKCNLFRNCLVAIIIILFVGASIVPAIRIIAAEEKHLTNNEGFYVSEDYDGNTLYVGGNGPDNYSKIQDAIDDANPGDTVFVYSGTYNEQVTIEEDSINLIGEDRETTIVDGEGLRSNWPVINICDTKYVNVSGFTVQNYQGISFGGLGILGGEYNRVVGNKCINNKGHGGIYVGGSNYCVVADNICNLNDASGIRMRCSVPGGMHYNTITNNVCKSNKYGIFLTYADNNIISDNNCSDNGQAGQGGYVDILLKNSNNNQLLNNILEGKYSFGITLSLSTNNSVKNNVCESGGIYIHYSDEHKLIENEAKKGIKINGEDLSNWNSHIIQDNTANNEPIYYYKDMDGDGITIPNNAAQVILANCVNFEMQNLNISNVCDGIQVGFSSDNEIRSNILSSIALEGITIYSSHNNLLTNNHLSNIGYNSIFVSLSNGNNISENDVVDNGCGIYLGGESNNNQVYKNIFTENGYGIRLFYKCKNNLFSFNSLNNNYYGIYSFDNFNNIFSWNNIIDNHYGIFLYAELNNQIYNNNIVDNSYGIQIDEHCINNVFSWNNISSNSVVGICTVEKSKGNQIYDNNFRWNNINAYDECENTWYNSVSERGNYWDDCLWTDEDEDGIADDPYDVPPGDNQDLYPLIKPWGIDDNHPAKPDAPSGPSSGNTGAEYTYTSNATDPDGDEIYYLFDWGDGTNSGWIGPYNSGQEGSATQIWSEKGNYEIRVKARDGYGIQSEWSDSLPVTMPRNRISINTFFIRLLERFPNAFPLLRHILGL